MFLHRHNTNIYTETIIRANGVKLAVAGTIFGCVYDGTLVAASNENEAYSGIKTFTEKKLAAVSWIYCQLLLQVN